MLNQEEIIQKLSDKSKTCIDLKKGELDYCSNGLGITFDNMPYIRFYRGFFIINKQTAKDFFNIVFEGQEGEHLEKIIKIFNIYSQFNYLLYTAKNDGFNISCESFDATYIKREINSEPEQNTVKNPTEVMSNLCLEISLGPMMECTLGMQNTAYSYQELYENVIYPQFQAMLKEQIGLEITDISQFDDRAFDLLKMSKI